MIRIILIMLAVLAPMACSGPTVCDAFAGPGLGLVVRDSVSGIGLASRALAVAHDGSYADTLLRAASDSQMWGAYERPSTYSLDVSAPGYLNWHREGIRVSAGECHVTPTGVRALLNPQ